MDIWSRTSYVNLLYLFTIIQLEFIMLLPVILRILQPGNPRNIVNWDRYVLSLGLRTEPFKTRFTLAPFVHSPIAKLLMEMLLNIDIKFLLSIESDFDKYTSYLDPMMEEFRTLFDPVHNPTAYKLFNGQLNSTVPTYLINVERDRPLHTLPMGEGWNKWSDIRTVRVLYHDAPELITDLNSFSIKFKGPEASRIIISIDISATLMKWLKYAKYCRDTNDEIRAETFIQNHIVGTWFDDLRRIWITNILIACMKGPLDINKFTSDQIIAPQNMMLSCINDIYRIISDAKSKNIRLNDFFATEWFGNYGIYAWMVTLQKEYSAPDLRQYTGIQFMSEIPYLNLIIRANNLIGTHDSAKMNRDLQYYIRRHTDANIFNNILNPQLREQLKTEYTDLLELTNKNLYL